MGRGATCAVVIDASRSEGGTDRLGDTVSWPWAPSWELLLRLAGGRMGVCVPRWRGRLLLAVCLLGSTSETVFLRPAPRLRLRVRVTYWTRRARIGSWPLL
ncbi:hypothetical protein BRADI_1g33045v3 [Brachypodium distachyon]|uniref:Uncharacterized protein n=1 Tax=Brachypodium distachyon TaxID=15368 RepID=A0A2K2DMI1_BRADI|nr:hypothetical protein BRADI_1g33045v3 [Brachypodium distachyon]